MLPNENGLCILEGDLGEWADKSAMAAINRALRFTRKDAEPESAGSCLSQPLYAILLLLKSAEILRKGGGAFDAISMDHFFTMRDLQECVARQGKMSGP